LGYEPNTLPLRHSAVDVFEQLINKMCSINTTVSTEKSIANTEGNSSVYIFEIKKSDVVKVMLMRDASLHSAHDNSAHSPFMTLNIFAMLHGKWPYFLPWIMQYAMVVVWLVVRRVTFV
jgi:hypothetical protein